MLSHAEYAKHDAKLDAGVTVSDAYHMRNTKLCFASFRFVPGVLCPHCHHSGSPHVIDVSELSEASHEILVH